MLPIFLIAALISLIPGTVAVHSRCSIDGQMGRAFPLGVQALVGGLIVPPEKN